MEVAERKRTTTELYRTQLNTRTHKHWKYTDVERPRAGHGERRQAYTEGRRCPCQTSPWRRRRWRWSRRANADQLSGKCARVRNGAARVGARVVDAEESGTVPGSFEIYMSSSISCHKSPGSTVRACASPSRLPGCATRLCQLTSATTPPSLPAELR